MINTQCNFPGTVSVIKHQLLPIILWAMMLFSASASADSMYSGFLTPPKTAMPQTWWHWMNGNITREGITADLEAMHKVGIGEANIVTIDFGLVPPGPVKVMSPRFLDLVLFAAKVAHRLGMTLSIDNCSGWSSSGGPWVNPEVSMQGITTSQTNVKGPIEFSGKLVQPPPFPAGAAPFYGVEQPSTILDYYRDIAVLAYKAPSSPLLITNHFYTKAAFQDFPELNPAEVEKDEQAPFKAEQVVNRDSIINLTTKMTADGTLTWNVPEGNWTIERIGYIPNGVVNKAGSPEATGPECNKLDPVGIEACWRGMMQPVLNHLGSLSGTVLDGCLIDSWEVRDQNWSSNMLEDFKRLRGYDPTPYLPVMSGQVVDNPAVSERFLWDVRRTVSDLFAQNYYGHFTQLCHMHRLKSLVEPYTGPYESLQCGAANDVPMGEFWAGGNGIDVSVKMAASVGHIYGHQIVGAESFTSGADHGNWTDDPYSLKARGDLAFCQGINRISFHSFPHQPWPSRLPGMTMGPFGINFERSNTWFGSTKSWMTYLSRCQFLLQQGRVVTDAAYFCGESVPVVVRNGNPVLPSGYDYDDINSDVLLHNAKVKDGRIVLTSGASYAALILPPDDINMTVPVIDRLRTLVEAGATVIGPRPQHSPSLTNYPNCDYKVQEIAGELWNKCDGTTELQNNYGKGRVIWGKSLAEVFAEQNLCPDFICKTSDNKSDFPYIHRVVGNTDIYFVSNQQRQAEKATCTFRIKNKVPELWCADTGKTQPAPIWESHNGMTTVQINFDPAGSAFVIFRPQSGIPNHAVAAVFHPLSKGAMASAPERLEVTVAANGNPAVTMWSDGEVTVKMAKGQILNAVVTNLPAPQAITGSWKLDFPPHWGAPPSISLDQLISWPDDPDNGVRFFSGTATYQKDVQVDARYLVGGRQLWLDLGTVYNIADVTVNGRHLGVLWKPPLCVNITSAANPGTNHLSIKITNLWPNRIIGDEQLPPDCDWNGESLKSWPQWLLEGKPSPTGRFTFTTWRHWTKDSKLLDSGLLGPVTLRSAAVVTAR